MKNTSNKSLLNNLYPKKAIGHRMTTRVPVAPVGKTAMQIHDSLLKKIEDYDEIHFIYLTDEKGYFKGILSFKDLLRLSPERKVSEALHQKHLITLTPEAHQEKAAFLALRHNLKVVPIVDKKGIFLGTVPEDAILEILHLEMREDISRLSGIHPEHGAIDDIFKIPYLQAIKHRLPWLILGLAGGLITARFVGFFEQTLAENLILASFIPLIVYMSDAVGTQMEVFVIRDFALHQNLNYPRYFLKQFLIVLLIALLLGGGLTLLGFLIFRQTALLPAVLGISLIISILSSVFTGLMIPYLFRRLNLDPANASGPIATIIQDFLSVMIYFSIASWILGFGK